MQQCFINQFFQHDYFLLRSTYFPQDYASIICKGLLNTPSSFLEVSFALSLSTTAPPKMKRAVMRKEQTMPMAGHSGRRGSGGGGGGGGGKERGGRKIISRGTPTHCLYLTSPKSTTKTRHTSRSTHL